ncbi:hypothetical protein [Collimonas sp. OK307]|uniref:hypothetical protein n=1 Tax=Collimonas sp. OK307 TaxID=1801620 RepID=UPI0011140492|nr:hypothetical protein [Collimonas sp. OK307]
MLNFWGDIKADGEVFCSCFCQKRSAFIVMFTGRNCIAALVGITVAAELPTPDVDEKKSEEDGVHFNAFEPDIQTV